MFTICVSLLCLYVVAIGLSRYKRNTTGLPLPPGPKRLPLIGRNFLQFPLKEPAKAFTQWRALYGDMIYMNDIGGPVLVLNSRKAAADLLDRRSAIYSDRPFSVMFHELAGFDWSFALAPYSEQWRQHRRLFHQYFHESASQKYREIQEHSAQAFLNRLLQDPERFLEHIRVNFVDNTLRILYGIPVETYGDTFVEMAEVVVKAAVDTFNPAVYPVNLVPILKHLPSWFPGGGFHKDAAEARLASYNLRQLPFEQAQKNTNSSFETSVLRLMLDKCEGSEHFTAEIAKNCCALGYVAGSDTSISAVRALFIALANYPDVRKRAQAELDAVTGSARLPTFSDMQDLPYINAIVKEILRWHNPVPLGLPHRLTTDDMYEGYFIPAGTVVFMNTWAILHDPGIYPEPYAFNPSRWLIDTPHGSKINDTLPDPDTAVFGAGRRICPGRHVARDSLFITAANVLACFNISPLDMAGNPSERLPEDNMTDGLLVYPLPFKVSIIPRSERAAQLITEAVV